MNKISSSANLDCECIEPARVVDFCDNWWVLDCLPEGWRIDKTAGSPYPASVFATNGKSILSGKQKRAIVKIAATPLPKIQYETVKIGKPQEAPTPQPINQPELAKTLNELARETFKMQILKDILFDLTVCRIEGWDKKEYINQIKALIEGIKL
jgi:hypothetical protein